jgi:HlyD family secretion protein
MPCPPGGRDRFVGAAWGFLLLAILAMEGCGERVPPDVVRLNGRIEARTVDLAPKAAGRVVEVRVREGDRVQKGDLLVQLDLGETAIAVTRDQAAVAGAQAHYQDLASGSRQSEIAAAEAEVAAQRSAVVLAQAEFQRQRTLLAEEITTQHDFDVAKANLDEGEAALKRAEDNLRLVREGFRRWQTEQARLGVEQAASVLRQSETLAGEAEMRAPADAVVLNRMAEPGLLLAPGGTALTLAFMDRLYVRTFIPETELGRVRIGAKATVQVDAFPGREFPAHVAEISPTAEFTPKPVETRGERVNLVYAAKVDLDRGWSEPLVPGQPAEVTVRAPAGGETPDRGASLGTGPDAAASGGAPDATTKGARR